MRILIDTNILIDREDYHIVPENLQKLMKLLNKPDIEILVHPRSVDDIKRDSDDRRRKVTLSKLEAYKKLERPPRPKDSPNFIKKTGTPSGPSERVDNDLLYAIYRDAVNYLITEDKGIHKKALILGINDSVLSIEEGVEILDEKFGARVVRKPVALQKEKVYNLDLNDPFFDSLKREYSDFEDWFKRISQEGRDCWVYYGDKNEEKIGALLIYKEEEESIGDEPPLPKKDRLKLCTFKVTHQGRKIGELFISLSVKYAIKKELGELYLTHFTKGEDYLVELISEYGFQNSSTKYHDDGREEDIFVKKLFLKRESLRNLSPTEISGRFWPVFKDGEEIKKFVVPIQPEYHNRLFVDYGERQTTIGEHMGEFIVEGNAIKKAYLCHSKIKKINPNNIVLFYRSRDRRNLTSVGVVEEIHRNLTDADDIIEIVGGRSVYSKDEIEEMSQKPTLVILFRWHFHLPNPLKLSELQDLEILKRAPQSIHEINHEKYQKIKKEGNIDERFTIY